MEKIDHHSGRKQEDGQKFVKYAAAAIVDIPGKFMCVVSLSDYLPLSCFVVCDMRPTVGVGVVK